MSANQENLVRNSAGSFSNDQVPADYIYTSDDDTRAQILTSNYFLDFKDKLSLGSVIRFKSSDQPYTLCFVSTLSDTTVAVTEVNDQDPAPGSITTAMIANAAVTAGKIDDDAVTTAKIQNGAVTREKLHSDIKIKYNQVFTTSAVASAPYENSISQTDFVDGDIALVMVQDDNSTMGILQAIQAEVSAGVLKFTFNDDPGATSKVNVFVMASDV